MSVALSGVVSASCIISLYSLCNAVVVSSVSYPVISNLCVTARLDPLLCTVMWWWCLHSPLCMSVSSGNCGSLSVWIFRTAIKMNTDFDFSLSPPLFSMIVSVPSLCRLLSRVHVLSSMCWYEEYTEWQQQIVWMHTLGSLHDLFPLWMYIPAISPHSIWLPDVHHHHMHLWMWLFEWAPIADSGALYICFVLFQSEL